MCRYRVPHIYTTIDRDENVEHTLKIQNRCAQAARLEKEGSDILDKTVRQSLAKLEVLQTHFIHTLAWRRYVFPGDVFMTRK